MNSSINHSQLIPAQRPIVSADALASIVAEAYGLDGVRCQGWRNYSIFMRDDGLLFGYLEAAENFAACLEGMSTEPANKRWQEYMAPFFEGIGGQHADQGLVELTEVFHLD